MSELDVREVKLQLRYPESRQEDITDAYMRGYKSVMQVTDKLITRLNEENEKLKAENAKLRELVQDFDKCLAEAVRLAYIQGHMTIYDGTLLDSLHPRMCELGIEVDE